MSQTIFVINEVDQQQLSVKREVRHVVQFPLNGKNMSGPGIVNELNTYNIGLFQPINNVNLYDPASDMQIPLTNLLGISSIVPKLNIDAKITRPIYCNSAGSMIFSDQSDGFKGQMPTVPQSMSSLSPFFSSVSGEMQLIGIYAITKVPFYNGYLAIALYSDLVLRSPGVKNMGRDNEVNANDWLNSFKASMQYGNAQFNGNSRQFAQENNSPLHTVNVYSKLIVLDATGNMVKELNFFTGYMDQSLINRQNLIYRSDMPSSFVRNPFTGGLIYSYCNNNSSFDYSWNKSYLGQALGLSASSVERIKKNAAEVGESASVLGEISKLASTAGRLSFSYGSLIFKPPFGFYDDKVDENEEQSLQRKSIEWINEEYSTLQIVRVSSNIGSNQVNFSVLLNKSSFYDLETLPRLITPSSKFGNVTWTLPLAYAYSHLKVKAQNVSSPFIFSYASSFNQKNYLFQAETENVYGNNEFLQFMYAGAKYSLSGDGYLAFSMPGASTTTPLSDSAFTSQGSATFFNDDVGFRNYFWDPTSWRSGAYPYKCPMVRWNGSIKQSPAYFENGGTIAMWLPPIGINERSI